MIRLCVHYVIAGDLIPFTDSEQGPAMDPSITG